MSDIVPYKVVYKDKTRLNEEGLILQDGLLDDMLVVFNKYVELNYSPIDILRLGKFAVQKAFMVNVEESDFDKDANFIKIGR